MDRGVDRSTLGVYMHPPDYHAGNTPYSLTYGTEAMIPIEVGEPTIQRADVQPHPQRGKPSGQPQFDK